MRSHQRKLREEEAMQQDVVLEWEAKLLEKEQELKLVVDGYEKKLRSIQAVLEEKDANLET